MSLKNKKSNVGNIILAIVIITLVVIGIRNLLIKKEKLEHYGTVTGRVVWLGSTAGNRVGQPECKCEFTINGKKMSDTYERKNLKLEIGNCLEIKYSLEDFKITDINYERGVISCSP